ncbi:hypothetical protein MJO29_015034 [Puccinia striiformis f. sp. tritici]|uniref:Uncharacterized protein n=2 Tax=Puccinia striiformis TaxID=27350 RepID=A0A0L0VVE0_9BASI|nr:hypothetical protein MJO29_015034 [Puccinia striiformis f. sp. tritici]KNF03236.1 hypothetical protein PSTG_03500 [Puccinia striiformis f. sp. tritici PST-78]POW11568.1 hypothetical protein PSHT_08432 [Puccinia striiformis]
MGGHLCLAVLLAALGLLLHLQLFQASYFRPPGESWPMAKKLLGPKQQKSSRSGFGSSSGGLWAKSTQGVRVRVERIYEKSNADHWLTGSQPSLTLNVYNVCFRDRETDLLAKTHIGLTKSGTTDELAPPTKAWQYETESLKELIRLFDVHPNTDHPDGKLLSKMGQVLGELAGMGGADRSDEGMVAISEYARALSYISGAHKLPNQLSNLQKASRKILVQRLGIFPPKQFEDERVRELFLRLQSLWNPSRTGTITQGK